MPALQGKHGVTMCVGLCAAANLPLVVQEKYTRNVILEYTPTIEISLSHSHFLRIFFPEWVTVASKQHKCAEALPLKPLLLCQD